MAREFAWWKGISAIPVCVALSIPADFSRADNDATPQQTSRRAVKIEAAKPIKAAPLDAGEAEPLKDEPAEVAAPIAEDGKAGDTAKLELDFIQERYPDGAIKIERYMRLDAQGNYIRHGAWTMYEPGGEVMARGRYEHGERHGTWVRIYKGDESPIFAQTPFKECKAPFHSQVAFKEGGLHGNWILTDAQQRKISEISFENGQRNGLAELRYASGDKMQSITYRDGLIEGQMQQWDADGKLSRVEEYQGSRRNSLPKISHYSNGQKRAEEHYRTGAITIQSPDDWWNARFAVYSAQGNEVKHGPSIAWHENGTKKSQGEYQNNQPVDKFTWWHATGQRSMEGYYQDGKPNGEWTWWHPNGQKAIQGKYQDGAPVGKWLWWKEDGRLAQSSDHSKEAPLADSSSKPASETATLPEETPESPSILKR